MLILNKFLLPNPKVNDNYKWLSIEVLNENKEVIYNADGKDFDWNAWYEPYARDWYWKGPEIGTERNEEFKTSFMINAGTYYIKVFNEDNTGPGYEPETNPNCDEDILVMESYSNTCDLSENQAPISKAVL